MSKTAGLITGLLSDLGRLAIKYDVEDGPATAAGGAAAPGGAAVLGPTAAAGAVAAGAAAAWPATMTPDKLCADSCKTSAVLEYCSQRWI